MTIEADYEERVRQQIEQYRDIEVHDLPQIFHYWSHNYLRLLLDGLFAEASIPKIYAAEFAAAMSATGNTRIASLGPGDAWTEVEIAKALLAAGINTFTIELVELSDHLLDRARARVAEEGVTANFIFTLTDINTWRATAPYAGIMANQALHHFQALEQIFDAVHAGLEEKGRFVSADTIGRNGHKRWPEARMVLQHFWNQLPERYKFHHQLKRLESPIFLDWDCSVEGFEGIRAEDILPLLVKKFGFLKFCAWGGFMDPFIDRGFGHNFSDKSAEDRAFIDRVQAANEDLLRIGLIKPTQMLAVMVKDTNVLPQVSRGLDPWSSIRDPKAIMATFD